jgi:hypothetical protein
MVSLGCFFNSRQCDHLIEVRVAHQIHPDGLIIEGLVEAFEFAVGLRMAGAGWNAPS